MQNQNFDKEWFDQYRLIMAQHISGATLQMATEALKHLILVNGGALAGAMTYIATTKPEAGSFISWSAALFGLGLFSALLSICLCFYANSRDAYRIMCLIRGENAKPKRWWHVAFGMTVDLSAGLSLLLFAGGLLIGGVHILDLSLIP